jgi:hypothetical protein
MTEVVSSLLGSLQTNSPIVSQIRTRPLPVVMLFYGVQCELNKSLCESYRNQNEAYKSLPPPQKKFHCHLNVTQETVFVSYLGVVELEERGYPCSDSVLHPSYCSLGTADG